MRIGNSFHVTIATIRNQNDIKKLPVSVQNDALRLLTDCQQMGIDMKMPTTRSMDVHGYVEWLRCEI